MDDSPGKRLKSFRFTTGLSQRALSKSLGMSDGLIGILESNVQPPSRTFLQRISDTYGVSADWLLTGEGDMLKPHAPGFGGDGPDSPRIDPPDYGKPMHGVVVVDGVEYGRIRKKSVDASAGNGLGPPDEGDGEGLLIPRDWLMRQRLAADLCVMVRARGDSMAPGISDGALILINAAERVNPSPGVYVLTLSGEVLVKRLSVLSKDEIGRPASVLLVSDNPAYPPRAILGDQLADLTIVGRVRGVFSFL